MFWVEMGGGLGGEMPTNRVFGPRNVMSNGCVVRTRIGRDSRNHYFWFRKEGSKRLSLISLGELWFLVRVSCACYWCRKIGSWVVMFLSRRLVLLWGWDLLREIGQEIYSSIFPGTFPNPEVEMTS